MSDHPDDLLFLYENIDLTSIHGETEHTINIDQQKLFKILLPDNKNESEDKI